MTREFKTTPGTVLMCLNALYEITCSLRGYKLTWLIRCRAKLFRHRREAWEITATPA